jgi:CRP-like cAMP-binding protein
MDYTLSALDAAEIALLPHEELGKLFLTRPGAGFAFWSLTLMDATVFRQAITNNGARTHVARVAHLFCEQYARAREAKLLEAGACRFPVNQRLLGQALGMSHISVNRAMQKIRKDRLAELRGGKLNVFDWPGRSAPRVRVVHRTLRRNLVSVFTSLAIALRTLEPGRISRTHEPVIF